MAREQRIARAVIFAPLGRDAPVAQNLLREADIASTICSSLGMVRDLLGDAVSFVVITEEAVASADLRGIAAWVAAQPSWSDLPFIILTRRAGGLERNPGAFRLWDILGNVTFLERPFHPTTFVSVARSARKGRERQFDARARMEELREGEARLRTALLAGHLGTWELDIDTWGLSCSDSCKAVFGRGPEQPFNYVDLLASIYLDDRPRVHVAIQRSVQSGQDLAIEYRNTWPDGTIHWVELRARIVLDPMRRDQSRQGPRLVGVSSDITARKAVEDTWRLVNETLEQRVRSRTAELEQAHQAVLEQIRNREAAEERLRQSQKMEMIGQLTGGIAHDFNNLLMAILANLDLLGKYAPPDSREQRLIAGALQGARRGAALTQRLLAFARNQDLNVEPVDLAALLQGMLDLLARSVGSLVEMRLEVAEGLPLALTDANQLEMALLNLVLNARDAMPGGGDVLIALDAVRVAVAGRDEPEGLTPGHYLRLVVKDSGYGMDPPTLARAIDPFFTTKGRGKGTGLGLSTIHGLAQQLNGALRLSSELGRGTRAELWLPAAEVRPVQQARPAALPPAAPQPAEPVAAEGDKTVPRATILVVDDDALIAMSTTGMLEDLGHEVIEAHSGAKAVAVLRDGPPVDLMITDFSMPGMTGLQLAKAARQLRPGLPILLATGYAELPSGETIVLPRLGKPYQQSELAAEIAKLLAPFDRAIRDENTTLSAR